MPYELFDHTGDLGIEARAPTLEELFAVCGRALSAILVEIPAPKPAGTDTFPVAGAHPDEELRDFLQELLYRFSAEHRVFVGFSALPGAVAASWEPYDPDRHPLQTELKAVTYHQLEVVREGEGWKGRVIFDV
jgi:SHS2 domain-containing protein